MRTAGYVLAGGASSRMGTNKALLAVGGRTLIEIVSSAVKEAAGSVTIVGPPDPYGTLGIPVIADRRANCGPLAGIESALSHTTADWNLIVACDMPAVHPGPLAGILRHGIANPLVMCVLPENEGGRPEPLCAAYRREILPAISSALNAGIRKVTEALKDCRVDYLRMKGDPVFQNINTPDEWREYRLALKP